MSIPYHGNWCGPGWSDGRLTPSTPGFAPAIDEFDETCRQHDFALAGGARDRRADADFVFANLGKGLKRSIAAHAVAARSLYQDIVGSDPPVQKIKSPFATMVKVISPSKEKPQKQNKKMPKLVSANRPSQGVKYTSAPVAVGTTIRASKPTLTRTNDSARMAGRDFIASVECSGSTSSFGLGKSALLSPAYFASTFLGNIARSFEKYHWNKLRIHYVPKVATNAKGQIILCSQRSVTEPGLQPESGTFLQRAMSQGNAVFSPLWTAAYIDIDVDNEFRLVDPTTTSDLDDCIHEELQVYTQSPDVGQVGYLIAEYDVTFKEPIYQPHSTSIPIVTGPGLRVQLTASAAINAVSDAAVFAEPAGTIGLATVPNGTVYRGVFDLQGSTAPTGTTFANALNVNTYSRGALGALNLITSTLPLIGGLTLYFTLSGSTLTAYTSLEAAINGAGTGIVVFRTATTAVGAFNFDFALVRQGAAILATIQ